MSELRPWTVDSHLQPPRDGSILVFLQLLEGAQLQVRLLDLVPQVVQLLDQPHRPRLVTTQEDLQLLLHLGSSLGFSGHVASVDLPEGTQELFELPRRQMSRGKKKKKKVKIYLWNCVELIKFFDFY